MFLGPTGFGDTGFRVPFDVPSSRLEYDEAVRVDAGGVDDRVLAIKTGRPLSLTLRLPSISIPNPFLGSLVGLYVPPPFSNTGFGGVASRDLDSKKSIEAVMELERGMRGGVVSDGWFGLSNGALRHLDVDDPSMSFSKLPRSPLYDDPNPSLGIAGVVVADGPEGRLDPDAPGDEYPTGGD